MSLISQSHQLAEVIVWPGMGSVEVRPEGLTLRTYSPGHVAVKTHNSRGEIKYISFWPPNCPWAGCKNKGSSHFHKEEEDKQAEQGPKGAILPKVYQLRLDVGKINAAFEAFKNSPYKWTSFGSSVLRQAYERNCSGLALYLLEVGGIYDVISDQQTLSSSRRITAICSSATALSSTSFFLSRPWELFQDIKHLDRFAGHYRKVLEANSEACRAFYKIHQLSKDILSKMSTNSVACTPTQSFADLANDWRDRLFEDSSGNFSLYTSFVSDLQLAKRHFTIASATILAPLVLAAMVVYLNQNLWLKTVTPSDVKNLAEKTENEQTGRNRKAGWNTKNVFVTSIGASVLGGLFLSRFIKH